MAGNSAKMTFGVWSSTWICDAIRVTRALPFHYRHTRTPTPMHSHHHHMHTH